MINIFGNRADIVAVKYYLAFQLVPILLDMVVLHHDNHHVHLIKELIEIQNLVLHNLLLSEEGVEGLQWTGQVALLNVEHLESRALTDVVYVLFIGEAIETDAAVVCDAVSLHDFVDALQHEHRLIVVCLHALVDDLGQLRIITYQEPGIY